MTELIRWRGPRSEEPPATIDIRRTPSEPIDPGQPSCLTTLPTELRNEVYKWLFYRDEPIIYSGSKSCRTPEFWSDYTQERSMAPHELKEMEEETKKENERLSTPPHDMGSSIATLKVCRQVYHEAVGVLYSNNTFLISCDLHRHNHSMSQLHIAASFLSGLGSQVSLLRHVAIDVDSMCPAGCDGFQLDDEDDFEIPPLVRVLWAHPSTSCRIHLTKTGRTVDRRILSPWFIDQGNRLPDRNVRLLEQIICAVGTSDNLDVQKYDRFERLIANIRVKKALSLVEVIFPSTGHDPDFDWQATTMTFLIHCTDEGGLYQLQKDEWKATDKLEDLPHNVSDKIHEYALTEQPVVFDLDRKTAQGFPYHLTQINRGFRWTTRRQFSLFNKVVAHMTTNKTTTDFTQWASLRHWLDNPISVLFSRKNFHMSWDDQN